VPIVDLHCDTLPFLQGKTAAELRNNSLQVDLARLRSGAVLAQQFAIYLDLAQEQEPYRRCQEILNWFHTVLPAVQDELMLVRSAGELAEARQTGRIAALLAIEDGGILEGKPERLAEMYAFGVRSVTLTWNYPNEIGYPNFNWQYRRQGLTGFGCQLVDEMQRLGMLVDVSHLSDQGFYDVAARAKRPFIASHSNARAVTDHHRNLTDDMIRCLAEQGGIMGFALVPAFLADDERGGMPELVQHIRHAYQVGGAEVLALGSDFDGTDGRLEISNSGEWPLLPDYLAAAGFSSGLIDKLCWQNAWRVLNDCL